MREPLKAILEKLAVDREMGPYETQPWLCYDGDRAITCSAEVRIGPGAEDLEAEVQFLYDNPADMPESAEDEDGDGASSGGGAPPPSSRASFAEFLEQQEGSSYTPPSKPKPRTCSKTGIEQLFIFRAMPDSAGNWDACALTIKGKSYVNEVSDWGDKGCAVFVKCIEAINREELPDIDEIVEKEIKDDFWGSGKRGRVGRKSPKANPAALMGMKKGM